jgi:hypothetical protein
MITIPGGTDYLGRRFDDFVVGAEHSVFAWCKIYIGQNPNQVALGFLGADFLSAAAKAKDYRLTMLGARGSNIPGARPHPTETDVDIDGTEEESNEAIRITLTLWDDKTPYRTMNAVYQQLAEGIKTRRFEFKPVYSDDYPDKLDTTLCVVGKDSLLYVAERVGGYGHAIHKMLAERERQKHDKPTGAVPTGKAIVQDPAPTPYPVENTGRRGRRQGSGSINDTQRITDMLQLLADGEATSVWAAAGQYSGGCESTQRRLHRKFKERWGLEPPQGETWNDIVDKLKPK